MAGAVVVALSAVSATASGAATAGGASGDLLVADYSFESGGTGWTFGRVAGSDVLADPACASAVTTTTDQHATGTTSLRLLRTGSCPMPGARSATVSASPGEHYRGYLDRFGATRSAVRLVFTDGSGRVLRTSTGDSRPSGSGWAPAEVDGTAPAGTAGLALQVDLAEPDQSGEPVYLDDAMLTADRTDLGPQISKASLNAATFGVDGQGRPTGYAVITGNSSYDAHLIGVDEATGALTTDVALPGATGAWNATTATDGSIYVGSYNYTDPSRNGRLYSYKPGADAATDLGSPIAGDTFVWDVTPGPDGSVFGGGYPSGGAFKYTPGAGFSQVGPRPLVAPEQYARTIAYDPSTDMVYVGIGSHAHLMACPGGGPTCTDILPKEYAGEEFAYSVSAGDGYVFANMSPSGDGHLVVLKVTKGADGTVSATAVKDIPTVKYPGASAPINGSVYYVGDSKLSRYDIATNTTTSLGMGLPVAPRAWGVSGSGDSAVLLTMGNGTGGPTVVSYDIAAGTRSSVSAPDAPLAPTELQSIQAGPDGKIYSSGFLTGGTGVYSPLRSDQNVQFSGVPQAEGSTVIGDTIYWGTYPGANIYAYRPDQPWKSGTNPKVVCSLTDKHQDRPYGMVNAGGRLYIGTEAGYGQLQGALSVYDPASGACTTQQNIVPDQTIASLAYLDGKVYGGTSIWGGLGIAPTQTEAKLLIADTETGTSRTVDLPTRGLRSVLAVTVGPDHRIWMVAENHILVYDPVSQRFVRDVAVFPELKIHDSTLIDAHDAFLTVGRDHQLYGSIHGAYLYRLDPSTMQVTILVKGNVHHVISDRYGDLDYVQNGYELRRLTL